MSSRIPAPAIVAEPIDWRALLAQFQDREAFVRKLADSVLVAHAETPARLRAAAASGDHETLAFLAHTLKGVGGNMKAAHVQTLATQTERDARTGHADTGASAAHLAEAVDAMLAALKARA
ncbi:MAG: Hpt domain-containing protein [Pseudomonadota bacterium]